MEKIDLTKLAGNKIAGFGMSEVPYEDIELLAEKINEIIDLLSTPVSETSTLGSIGNKSTECGSVSEKGYASEQDIPRDHADEGWDGK